MKVVSHAQTPNEIAQRGNLRTRSFADLLVALLDLQKTGTLRIVDGQGQVQALVRFDAGLPVAARVPRLEANLIQSLIPLCACADGDYVFDDERDEVGEGEGVVAGRVDPLALIAAVFRGPAREDAVSEVLGAFGGALLKVHPRVRIDRYRFTQQELQVVELLRRAPMSLTELESYLPERVVRRVSYVLKVTRGVSLLPANRRVVSGTVEHEAPLPSASGAFERPDATVRVSHLPRASVAASPSAAAPATNSQRPSAPTMLEQPAPGRYHVREPHSGASEQPLVVFEQSALSPSLQLWAAEIRERAAAIKHQDHFAALDVSRDCSAEALKIAFATLAIRFQPDALPDELGALRARAGRIFARLTEAYETLLDPQRRQQYIDELQSGPRKLSPEPQLRRVMEADTHYREAERLLRLSDHPAALDAALKAVRSDRSARNEALFAWLLCLRAGTTDQPRALQHLDNALRRDPQCVQAHYYKGMLYKRAGQLDEARVQWRRVLKLNPEHPEASRELRLLDMRDRPRSSSGLLGMLFSKPPGKANDS